MTMCHDIANEGILLGELADDPGEFRFLFIIARRLCEYHDIALIAHILKLLEGNGIDHAAVEEQLTVDFYWA